MCRVRAAPTLCGVRGPESIRGQQNGTPRPRTAAERERAGPAPHQSVLTSSRQELSVGSAARTSSAHPTSAAHRHRATGHGNPRILHLHSRHELAPLMHWYRESAPHRRDRHRASYRRYPRNKSLVKSWVSHTSDPPAARGRPVLRCITQYGGPESRDFVACDYVARSPGSCTPRASCQYAP